MVVLGVIDYTSPRSDADAAWGHRALAVSEDREQDIPDWLVPFTEGVVV